MDIQEKSHAFLNYSLGTVGITSPLWLDFLKQTEFWMHYFTVLGGFVLIIWQLYKNFKKK